jgi:hypothetical protein
MPGGVVWLKLDDGSSLGLDETEVGEVVDRLWALQQPGAVSCAAMLQHERRAPVQRQVELLAHESAALRRAVEQVRATHSATWTGADRVAKP